MELADCLRMAALIPAPGIGKSEVKGRASQSCTVRARPAASSPPSAAQSVRSGPLGATSPSPRRASWSRNWKRLLPAGLGKWWVSLDFCPRSESG